MHEVSVSVGYAKLNGEDYRIVLKLIDGENSIRAYLDSRTARAISLQLYSYVSLMDENEVK